MKLISQLCMLAAIFMAIFCFPNRGFSQTNPDNTTANFTISGNIQRNSGAAASFIILNMTGSVVTSTSTDAFGNYNFMNIPMGSTVTITPSYNFDYLQCVSVRDYVTIQKHIAGTILPSPYQWVEADVNKSNTISNADLTDLENQLIGVTNSFPNNMSWRFVPSTHVFPNPSNPLSSAFPESATITNIQSNKVQNFIGMKIADATDCEGDAPNTPFLTLGLPQKSGFVGSFVSLPVTVQGCTNVLGIQFTVAFSKVILEYIGPDSNNPAFVTSLNEGILAGDGVIRACLTTSDLIPKTLTNGSVLFNLKFKIIGSGSTGVLIANLPTKLEAVDAQCLPFGINVIHGSVLGNPIPCDSVACVNNVPVFMQQNACVGLMPNLGTITKVYNKCTNPPTDITSGFTFQQSVPVGTPISGNLPVKIFVKKTSTGEYIDTCTVPVILIDNVPPTCIPPADVTLNATCGQTCVSHNFTATASDNCGTTTITYSHAPNFCFPIGVTTVTVTAKDLAQNFSTCNFKVTVTDPFQQLSLICPQNITANADPVLLTAVVNYPLPVVNSACAATVTYSHPSNFAFPCGVTTVTCTATNGVKTVNCTFKVTVTCPAPTGLTFIIGKTASKTTVLSGEPFVFDINYSVSGTGTAQNVVITDVIDPKLDIINVITGSMATTYTITNNTVKINVGASASGGSKNVQINVKFKPGVTCDGVQICNSATITGKDGPDNITATSNQVCVTAKAADNWKITKNFIGGNIVNGSTWWQIVISSPSGNEFGGYSLSNVVLKDIFPAGAVLLTMNGSPTTGGTIQLGSIAAWVNYRVIDVFVKYPSSTFSMGQTVKNEAKIEYTLPCGQTVSKSAEATTILTEAIYTTSPYKWVSPLINLSGTNQTPTYSPGCSGVYNLSYYNSGNASQTNCVLHDFLPDAIMVNKISTDVPSGSSVTLLFRSKNNPANWQTALMNQTSSVNIVPNQFVQPLGTGDYLTELRWEYTNVPAKSGFLNQLVFKILANHQSAPMAALTVGESIQNKMETFSAQTPTHVVSTTNFTISPQRPVLFAKKYHVPPCGLPTPIYYPGDIVRFRMVVANTGNEQANICKITDNLESYLHYAGNAKYKYFTDYNATSTYPNCANFSFTSPVEVGTMTEPPIGATNLEWTFEKLPSSCTDKSNFLIIDFDVKIDVTPTMCPWGGKSNKFTFSASNTTMIADSGPAYFTVNSIYSIKSKKEVKKQNDPISAFSNTAFVPAGQMADYRLTLKNESNIGLQNLKFLDLLPAMGDVTVLPNYSPRMSDFDMFVNAPLNVTSSTGTPTATYSLNGNPIRSTELCAGIIEPTGATPGNFSSTSGSGKKALKIDFNNFTLPANSTLEVFYSVKVPSNAGVGKMACNSFGVTGTPLNSATCLIPAEGTPACVKVLAGDTCKCGVLSNMSIKSEKAAAPTLFFCGEPFNLPCPVGGGKMNIKGNFGCSMPGCSPTQMNCQILYTPTQTLIGNFPCTPNIDFVFDGNLIKKSGLYQLYFTAFCDGKPCSCIIGMNVKDCGSICKADFTLKALDECGLVEFINLSTGTGTLTYKWDFGDGSSISTLQNPTHQFGAAGTYPIKMTIQSSDTCMATTTINYTVGVLSNCGTCAISANNYLNFDGSDDFVNCTSPLGAAPTAFTVACWFRDEKTAGADGYFYRLFGWGGPIRFEVGDQDGVLTFFSTTNNLNFSTSNIRDGAWHHVAAVYKPGDVDIYLDGVLVPSLSNFPIGSIGNLTNKFHIGDWSAGGTIPRFWKGGIDEFKVWKTALSPNEIIAAMECGLDQLNTNLVLHFPFDEKIGGGNNVGTTGAVVTNFASNGATFNGTLTNFAQNGPFSNWETNSLIQLMPCSSSPFVFIEGNERPNLDTRVKIYSGEIYTIGSEGTAEVNVSKPTFTHRKPDGTTAWRTVFNLNGSLADFVLTADGCDFLLVGNLKASKTFVARVDGVTGNIQWIHSFDVGGREALNRIILSENPIDAAFPYIITGVLNPLNSAKFDGQIFYMNDAGDTYLVKNLDAGGNENPNFDLAQMNGKKVLAGHFNNAGVLVFCDSDLNLTNNTGFPSTVIKGVSVVRFAQPTADGKHLLVAGSVNSFGFLAKLDYSNLTAPTIDWAVKFPKIKYFTKILERADGSVHALGVRKLNGILEAPVVVGGQDNGNSFTANWQKYFNKTGESSWGLGDIQYFGVNNLFYTDWRINASNGFGGRDILEMVIDDDFSNVAGCLVKDEFVKTEPMGIALKPLSALTTPKQYTYTSGGTVMQDTLQKLNPCALPACDCVYEKLQFSKKGSVLVADVACGNNIPYELPCPGQFENFYFKGFFKCLGNCEFTNLTWNLKNPTGNSISSGIFANGIISVGLTLPMLQTAGVYTIELVGKCGTKVCTCTVKFKVPQCPVPCSCDSPIFFADVKKGFQISNIVPQPLGSCKYAFTPNQLTDCDKVTWRLAKSSDQVYTTVGTSVGNVPFFYNFPTADQYTICMDVTRTVPFSSPTQTCTKSFCITDDIECASFGGIVDRSGANCLDGKVQNGDYLEGAVEGGLLSGGEITAWNASGGEPFVSIEMGATDSNFVQLHGNYAYSDRLFQTDLPPIQGNSKIKIAFRPISNSIVAGSELVVRVSKDQQDSSACIGNCQEILRTQIPDADPQNPDIWYLTTSYDSIMVEAKYLTIHVENPFFDNDESLKSIVDIDNICLRQFNFVGTKDENAPSKTIFNLYPNPTTGLTRVEWKRVYEAHSIETVAIIDPLGRIIRKFKVPKNSIGLDMSLEDLSPGFYLIKIETDEQVLGVLKLIKQ
jgi:fimbrial isopeptide formation D2 family protein/uncharacterized repeat protein (TIGR01451 family)